MKEVKQVKSLYRVDNNLIRNKINTLSLVESRCIRLLLKQIYTLELKGTTLTSSDVISITAKDYMNFVNINPNMAIVELQQVAKILEVIPSIQWRDSNSFGSISWFDYVTYDSANQQLSVRFGQSILPFISSLTRDFSKIPLFFCQVLKSSRHLVMLEWLYSYKDLPQREIKKPLEYLYSIWNVPTSLTVYPFFKRDILLPFKKIVVSELKILKYLEIIDKGIECRSQRKVVNIKIKFEFNNEKEL